MSWRHLYIGAIQEGSARDKAARESEGFVQGNWSRAPGSTAQAVLSWREPRDPDGSSETNGNWWQVLGPAGTSADFLLNSPVLGGAVIRLQHVSSGAFLRGDGSQPAFTRKDLREVSAAAAAVSPSDVDRSSIEWQLTVNGTSVERLEWGLAWATFKGWRIHPQAL